MAEQLDTDVAELRQRLESGDVVGAVSLYHGELLSGFHLPDNSGFTHWLDQTREELRRTTWTAARRGAVEAEEAERWDEALTLATAAARIHPLNGESARHLARLMVRTGDRAGALLHLESFARRLEADLETRPDEATLELMEELRTAVAPAASDVGRGTTAPTPPSRVQPGSDTAHRETSAPPEPPPPATLAPPAPPKRSVSDRRPGPVRAAVAAVAVTLVALAGIFSVRSGAPDEPVAGERPGLAVLPLESVGTGVDDDYVARALHGELVARVARDLPVRVVAGAAMQRYADHDGALSDIARELGVDYVVSGTAQVEDSRIRTTIELVDGRSEEVLWAESYDGDVAASHLLTVQADVSRRIAESLRLGEGDAAREAIALAAHLRRVEPRDLWFLNDYSRTRLLTFASLGDADAALAELEGLLEGGFANPMTTSVARIHPMLDPIRSDPRFDALLTRARSD